MTAPHPALTRRDATATWLILALCLSPAAMLALMIHNRLFVAVDSRGFLSLVAIAAILGMVRWSTGFARTGWQLRLRDFSEAALALIAIAAMGAIGSYETAADTSGFADAALAHSDRLLHFDWLAVYTTVVQHPLLQHLGAAAYGSIYLSPWLVLGWLAWHGERTRAHRFLLTFWIAAALTLALFPLLPARGALQFLWHGPIRYMPTSGLYQGEIIPALRLHTIHAIDLGAVRGLVCAPSFHTACAVMFIAAAWPFPALRRLILPINLAMLAATPVEGTHYLTDMIMGAAVAFVAILSTRWLAALGPMPPQPQISAYAASV